MKKSKKSTYLRYEFTNKKGALEGGDIFSFATTAEAKAMITKILKVAHSDQVTVNLTIGPKASFFGFLKNVGMTQKDLDHEMVDPDQVSAKR